MLVHKSEWDAPAKVTVDEQEKIDKGEMEDPNAGMKVIYRAVTLTVRCLVLLLLQPVGPLQMFLSMSILVTEAIKNVVTNAEFEKLAKEGKVPANVAFIQSPGGKDNDKDFPYCNSVTSMVALKQAQYVREDNPGRAGLYPVPAYAHPGQY